MQAWSCMTCLSMSTPKPGRQTDRPQRKDSMHQLAYAKSGSHFFINLLNTGKPVVW